MKTPMWQRVIASAPVCYHRLLLRRVLKTRKAMIPLFVNGVGQFVPRAEVRDYLRAIL